MEFFNVVERCKRCLEELKSPSYCSRTVEALVLIVLFCFVLFSFLFEAQNAYTHSMVSPKKQNLHTGTWHTRQNDLQLAIPYRHM